MKDLERSSSTRESSPATGISMVAVTSPHAAETACPGLRPFRAPGWRSRQRLRSPPSNARRHCLPTRNAYAASPQARLEGRRRLQPRTRHRSPFQLPAEHGSQARLPDSGPCWREKPMPRDFVRSIRNDRRQLSVPGSKRRHRHFRPSRTLGPAQASRFSFKSNHKNAAIGGAFEVRASRRTPLSPMISSRSPRLMGDRRESGLSVGRTGDPVEMASERFFRRMTS